jgi:hypothetical protein
VPDPDDPVLRRRAQMARLASAGRGIGWLFVLLAVVAFVIGLATSFDPWGTVVVVALVACTLTLAPAIVLGYAVKAAERDDRERR